MASATASAGAPTADRSPTGGSTYGSARLSAREQHRRPLPQDQRLNIRRSESETPRAGSGSWPPKGADEVAGRAGRPARELPGVPRVARALGGHSRPAARPAPADHAGVLLPTREGQDTGRLDRARRRVGRPAGGNPLDRRGQAGFSGSASGTVAHVYRGRPTASRSTVVTPATSTSPGPGRRPEQRWLYFQARPDNRPALPLPGQARRHRPRRASPPRTSRGHTSISSPPTAVGDPSVFGGRHTADHRPCPLTRSRACADPRWRTPA